MRALGLLFFLLAGCELCGHELIKEAPSPERKYIATVFESNCGATTPFITQVVLRKEGRTFSADNEEDVVFRVKEKEDVEVRWINAEQLLVRRFPNKDAIFKEMGDWHGVKITYVAEWPTSSSP